MYWLYSDRDENAAGPMASVSGPVPQQEKLVKNAGKRPNNPFDLEDLLIMHVFVTLLA
jgi:hypothetical protein